MADPDFEEQLRQENLEQAKKEGSFGTYTDADGTVFEWDAEKKAYFPKIDDDFIAKYQMSYGQGSEQETSKEGASSDDTKTEEEKRKEYEQYCKDYYNYYYSNQTTGENGKGGDNSGKGDNSKEEYSYEDYMAYCNYYYGQNYSEGQEGNVGKEEEKEEKDKMETAKEKPGDKRNAKSEPGWFEHQSEKSTHVYVSGLPLDITADEFKELMSKYGLIMYDPFTRKPKVKLYRDETGQPKGDGLCCYIKQESVELALNILDGSEVRGHKVSVERAQFQMKGQYDPGKKRKKLSNKDKRKIKEKQEKLFDWRPEKAEGRLKCEKTVVLKNMFDPKEFEENPMIINELRVDVRAEASKFGEVKKVTVFDRHMDGVITVRYKEAEEADLCVSSLNGRWFAKRRIIAQTWDGQTKYEVEETEAEREARLNKWHSFLEKGDAKSDGASAVISSESATTSTESATVSTEAATVSTEAATVSTEAATVSTEAATVSTEAATTSTEAATVSTEAATVSTETATTSREAAVTSAPLVTSPAASVAADASVSSETPFDAVTVTSHSESEVKECKGDSALVEDDACVENNS